MQSVPKKCNPCQTPILGSFSYIIKMVLCVNLTDFPYSGKEFNSSAGADIIFPLFVAFTTKVCTILNCILVYLEVWAGAPI